MTKKFTKLIPETEAGGGVNVAPLYNLSIGFMGEFSIIGGMKDGILTPFINITTGGEYNDKAMGVYIERIGTYMSFSGTLTTLDGTIVGDGGESIGLHFNEPLFLQSDVSYWFDS